MNVSKLKALRLENVSRVRIIYSRILNLVTGWGVWSASRAGRFVFWERAFGTHLRGRWVSSRAGTSDLEKRLCQCRVSNPGFLDVQPIT